MTRGLNGDQDRTIKCRRVSVCLPVAMAIAALLVALAPRSASSQTAQRCFSETNFCISGRIREFWEQNGGLPVFGFPLGAQEEMEIEGKLYQAQVFERNRLELHPENAKPYDVLLGRVGAERLEQEGRDWFTFPKSAAKAGCRYFPETGHNICGEILKAWHANGLEIDGKRGKSEAENLALFGAPLSDEMPETVEGKQYTVQWFERARFELHPENAPPYNVLLGRLGAELLSGAIRYVLPGEQVFPEGVAFQSSTGNFFVSSNADGTIFRGDLKHHTAQVFLAGGADGRTSATGMKVDDLARLLVSGGATGKMFVYNVTDGTLLANFSTNRQPTFINDVIVAPNGDAFFTDSQSPILYRVFTNPNGVLASEPWLNFTNTPLQYQQGFNLNGIAVTGDGRYLITVQTNTGKLWRIATATKEIEQINLGGQLLTNGDGILLDGRTLYVVRNQDGVIVKIQLAEDYASGTVVSSTGNPLFAYPTTIAKANDRLLVVNSQFDKRGGNAKPVLPFTIVTVVAP